MANKPRVAVFGLGGFSGHHFERFVAREGLGTRYDFFGLTRDATRAERTGVFTYREGDPCRPGEAADFLAESRPDYVLNLVGAFRAEGLEPFMRIHVGVSNAICEAALSQELPVQKIVLVGSAAEYGAAPSPVSEDAALDPLTWYGLSKLYQTELARYYFRNHGLPVVVARTFNILGEGLSADLSIGSFMRQIAELPAGGALKVGNIETSRDFLDAAEVSRRYWVLLTRAAPGEVYNVCSGEPRTMRSIVQEMVEHAGKQLSIEVDQARIRGRDIQVIYGNPSKFDRLDA